MTTITRPARLAVLEATGDLVDSSITSYLNSTGRARHYWHGYQRTAAAALQTLIDFPDLDRPATHAIQRAEQTAYELQTAADGFYTMILDGYDIPLRTADLANEASKGAAQAIEDLRAALLV